MATCHNELCGAAKRSAVRQQGYRSQCCWQGVMARFSQMVAVVLVLAGPAAGKVKSFGALVGLTVRRMFAVYRVGPRMAISVTITEYFRHDRGQARHCWVDRGLTTLAVFDIMFPRVMHSCCVVCSDLSVEIRVGRPVVLQLVVLLSACACFHAVQYRLWSLEPYLYYEFRIIRISIIADSSVKEGCNCEAVPGITRKYSCSVLCVVPLQQWGCYFSPGTVVRALIHRGGIRRGTLRVSDQVKCMVVWRRQTESDIHTVYLVSTSTADTSLTRVPLYGTLLHLEDERLCCTNIDKRPLMHASTRSTRAVSRRS